MCFGTSRSWFIYFTQLLVPEAPLAAALSTLKMTWDLFSLLHLTLLWVFFQPHCESESRVFAIIPHPVSWRHETGGGRVADHPTLPLPLLL